MNSTRNGSSVFLVDTNILVYAHDPSNHVKAERAILVITSLAESQRAVLSVQCLSEFFNISA